jgi:hypothetical protein
VRLLAVQVRSDIPERAWASLALVRPLAAQVRSAQNRLPTAAMLPSREPSKPSMSCHS